jgi:hypothetical protein
MDLDTLIAKLQAIKAAHGNLTLGVQTGDGIALDFDLTVEEVAGCKMAQLDLTAVAAE